MSTVETAARAIRERDEARAVASAMLAALTERRDELNRRWPPASGMAQTVIDAKTAKLDALIAQAEAAGIKVEP